MKKKEGDFIKRLIITLLLIFMFSFNVFASGSWVYGVGEFDDNPDLSVMQSFAASYLGYSGDYFIYYNYESYSGRSKTAFYIPFNDNMVIVPNYDRTRTLDGELQYEALLCTYDSESDTISTTSDINFIRYYEDSNGALYFDTLTLFLTDDFYFYSNADEFSSSVPVASSLDNATTWLQHQDAAYLVNGDLFVDVPVPEDVAMYEASEEQNIYLYWENSEGFPEGVTSITDNSKQTWIEYGYYYKNVNDEWKFITGDVVEDILPYNRRTQYNISTAPLDGYETGAIIGRIQNKWTLGGIGEALPSPYVEFFYIPYLNEYYVYYYDDEGNYIKMNSYPLNDYGSKNDAFTGGVVPNSDLMVSSPADSDVDYNFFSYLFNGFGLLGNNGIVAAIGSFFTYLPKELMALLIGGVAAVIGVAIFKYFAKA